MTEEIQETYLAWQQREQQANQLASRLPTGQQEVIEARKAASEAWLVYWEQRQHVERSATGSFVI